MRLHNVRALEASWRGYYVFPLWRARGGAWSSAERLCRAHGGSGASPRGAGDTADRWAFVAALDALLLAADFSLYGPDEEGGCRAGGGGVGVLPRRFLAAVPIANHLDLGAGAGAGLVGRHGFWALSGPLTATPLILFPPLSRCRARRHARCERTCDRPAAVAGQSPCSI